jgi:hypothetical protein
MCSAAQLLGRRLQGSHLILDALRLLVVQVLRHVLGVHDRQDRIEVQAPATVHISCWTSLSTHLHASGATHRVHNRRDHGLLLQYVNKHWGQEAAASSSLAEVIVHEEGLCHWRRVGQACMRHSRLRKSDVKDAAVLPLSGASHLAGTASKASYAASLQLVGPYSEAGSSTALHIARCCTCGLDDDAVELYLAPQQLLQYLHEVATHCGKTQAIMSAGSPASTGNSCTAQIICAAIGV